MNDPYESLSSHFLGSGWCVRDFFEDCVISVEQMRPGFIDLRDGAMCGQPQAVAAFVLASLDTLEYRLKR